jgi:DNA ligase-1
MELSKIYKRDVSGNIRVWWAETDNVSQWRTHSGTLTGEIITSVWRYAPAKSQSNTKEQALFEAKAEMKKKLRTDYKESIKDIDQKRNSIIKPMLAHTYQGWEGRQCFAQPKLDGMRCLATPYGLWSRNNRRIISAPHIEARLKSFFKENSYIILDGELYNHDLHNDFNSIMSMAKKTKPSFEDLELSKKYLQYWVYDCYDSNEPDLTFIERFTSWRIQDIFSLPSIFSVDAQNIESEEELDLHYAELLRNGYEGQIIRYNRPYEQKRSANLLKRKDFLDEEFDLIDIEEGAGNWEGYAKRAICAMSNGTQFGAGISGTQEFCAQLLKNKNKYKSVTIKYLALTPDGVPRFPIAIKFWENKYDALKEQIQPKRDLFA